MLLPVDMYINLNLRTLESCASCSGTSELSCDGKMQ